MPTNPRPTTRPLTFGPSKPKAAAMGSGVLAAVGAPSSLAVQAAESFSMTVLGFVRQERYNIYSHSRRLVVPES